jgi:hypothetical protein
MGVTIISPERFKSTYESIKERYYEVLKTSEKKYNHQELQEKFLEENSERSEKSEELTPKNRFKKVQKILIRMKSAYARPKMYAIKNLNALEKYQIMFKDEERAVIVQMIELMEKVILHKKLNKEY